MNQIVFTSSKGNAVTNSLIVAEIFEKNHKDVLRDISNLSCSENFRQRNFAPSSYTSSQNKKLPMYIMTKDGFSFLVMGYTGEKAGQFKESFIEAFNAMESKIRQSVAIPQSFAEALRLAAAQQEEIDQKNKQLAIQAPKVSFADRVIDSGNLVDIGQAAKLLKLPYGRNTFFKELRERGVFFKNRNEPKQEFIERGYFELRETEIPRENHPPMMVTKILVKQPGLFWLSRKFGCNYENGLPALNGI